MEYLLGFESDFPVNNETKIVPINACIPIGSENIMSMTQLTSENLLI